MTADRDSALLRWLFLAPTMLGIGIFVVLPIVGSLALAFFRWDIITSPQFVGLENFADLATDRTVGISFLNTAVFVLFAVTAQLVVAMLLAEIGRAHV